MELASFIFSGTSLFFATGKVWNVSINILIVIHFRWDTIPHFEYQIAILSSKYIVF